MISADLEAWRRNSAVYHGQKEAKTFGLSLERTLEMPVVTSLLGEIKGKQVLDLGCGDGEFGEVLAGRGARVVGLDGSESQLERAWIANPGRDYRLADISQRWPVADGEFDDVTSRFTLMFVGDLAHVGREAVRVLKPEGRFVMTITHPFYPYLQAMLGVKHRYSGLEVYGEEKRGEMRMSETVYPFYFRPVESYIKPMVESGLTLIGYKDIVPTEEILKENSDLARMVNKPVYLVLAFAKKSR